MDNALINWLVDGMGEIFLLSHSLILPIVTSSVAHALAGIVFTVVVLYRLYSRGDEGLDRH